MTQKKHSAKQRSLQELMEQDQDLLRGLMKEALQQVLEAEMEEALQAGKGERSGSRLGYRSGYYTRSLVTRVGKLELRVPQDRSGHFRTEVFERYQRSEKALVASLMEMYVQGVSTRKVKAITEELCGHEFSASTVSSMVKRLDEELEQFAQRRLEEAYPYVILDARYEKVREDGTVRSQAVLVAIGINHEGRRCVLGVELANRESASRRRLPVGRQTERRFGRIQASIRYSRGMREARATAPPMPNGLNKLRTSARARCSSFSSSRNCCLARSRPMPRFSNSKGARISP